MAAASDLGRYFFAINSAARDETVALRRTALAHLRDPNPDIHYAAVYSLALTADANNGAGELAALLGSPLVDDRLLSASALAGLGDGRALPVLIAALDDRSVLLYRDTPERACDFAKSQLLRFTRQDLGLKTAATVEQIAATKPAWEKWWQTGGTSVHFDPQVSRFVE